MKEAVELYDKLIEAYPEVERKGENDAIYIHQWAYVFFSVERWCYGIEIVPKR